MALFTWLMQAPPPEDTILLLDADCIFITAYDEPLERGQPIAQLIGYMHSTTTNGVELLKRHGYKPESVQPIGIPIMIHQNDLRVLLPRWQEQTEAIRNDPISRELAGWTADMWGCVFASADLGLRYQLQNLAHWQMDDRIDLPFIHYCYSSSNAQGNWEWTKRTYKPWVPVTKPPPNTPQATVMLISLLNEFAEIIKTRALGA
jgi:hypothetical protein